MWRCRLLNLPAYLQLPSLAGSTGALGSSRRFLGGGGGGGGTGVGGGGGGGGGAGAGGARVAADHLFVSLDLFESMLRQQIKFDAVLEHCEASTQQSCTALLDVAVSEFLNAGKRALRSFVAGICDGAGGWGRAATTQGAVVHELTTTTLSFARRCSDYGGSLESECADDLRAAVRGCQPRTVLRLIVSGISCRAGALLDACGRRRWCGLADHVDVAAA
jgi:hypothetical protein